jgi:RNA polymerase sigma factor (sigma-70 family)
VKTNRTTPLENAWEEFYPSMVRYASALVGPASAHDIVVEVFLRLPDYVIASDRSHLTAFLRRSITNQAKNHYRTNQRRLIRERLAFRQVSAQNTGSQKDLLGSLSPQIRAVLFLKYWDQQTAEEIGAQLGVSSKTVRRRLQQGLSLLQKEITNEPR